MQGWFELSGGRREVVRKISSESHRPAGTIYVVEFGDDTVKIGKSRRPKDRLRNFETTAEEYRKEEITRVAITPRTLELRGC